MIANLTQQVMEVFRRTIVMFDLMSVRSKLLPGILLGLLFGAGLQRSTGTDIWVFPYEPVVLSVPYSTNHLAHDFWSEVVISCPNERQFTNQVTRMNLMGVADERSQFLLYNQTTNFFISTGLYQAVLEEVTNSVTVLAPIESDASVIPILDSFIFYRILLASGRESLDSATKAKCQQIVAESPAGKYAMYANTYLAFDALYSELLSIYDSGMTPNLTTAGTQVVSLLMPTNHFKWTVLYHKGYVFGLRQATNEASSAFTTLRDGIQHSPWSKNADLLLEELAE